MAWRVGGPGREPRWIAQEFRKDIERVQSEMGDNQSRSIQWQRVESRQRKHELQLSGALTGISYGESRADCSDAFLIADPLTS